MTLGLALFIGGLVLWVIESKVVVYLSESSNKFVIKHEKSVEVIGIGLTGLLLLCALVGLIIILAHKWWLAIILFFFVMPYIVNHVSE
jgi:hypothetical protein